MKKIFCGGCYTLLQKSNGSEQSLLLSFIGQFRGFFFGGGGQWPFFPMLNKKDDFNLLFSYFYLKVPCNDRTSVSNIFYFFNS
jgi:hypothetical protein